MFVYECAVTSTSGCTKLSTKSLFFNAAEITKPARKNIVTHFVIFLYTIINYKINTNRRRMFIIK
jgi:hypothetical protein